MPNDEIGEDDAFEEEIDEIDEIKEIEEVIEDPADKTEPSFEQISIAEIPIKIGIEVTRFEVTLEELSKMEPGYKLPIEINPRIVHLTSSGKVIGKGEIIEIGDTIGVKILELYH